MSNRLSFETNSSIVTVLENGVIFVKWTHKIYDDLEAIKTHVFEYQAGVKHLPQIILSDIRNVKSVSRPVRDFLSSTAIIQPIAHAMLANSALARMIGNLYLRFNKPVYPNKIFSDQKLAEAWLLTF